MSYLPRLGLQCPNYDRTPVTRVSGGEDSCRSGWTHICQQLQEAIAVKKTKKVTVAIECYSGVLDEELIPALRDGLHPGAWHSTLDEAFLNPEQIDALTCPELGDDTSTFGRLTRLKLVDFLDPEKRTSLQQAVTRASGLSIVYGPAALLCCEPDIIIYADMPRWEIQQRQRANRISNLGIDNRQAQASRKYRRSFFVDWRVCDKLKQESFGRWDYVLDTSREKQPVMVTADAYRKALRQLLNQPFRLVPFFDPGVWGGQWLREIARLPEEAPNYAWCFDCVPEENSLLLDFGTDRFETPGINLVLFHPKELMGEPVYGRFGASFPIRFDLLDTMQGQNLSFQVHPLIDYAAENFGLRFTQEESYYLLDAEPGALVFLGLKDDVDASRMIADLHKAQETPSFIFPDDKYVARFPVQRHDHILIPAGVCHCSGTGCLVLEVSHTPYIFTFKLWDWARLDLNGQPRPISLKHGVQNIDWSQTESRVKEELINRIEPIASGNGWREERTGLSPTQFIETRRHWFSNITEHDTGGNSVHVLNLVAGSEAIVESPAARFEPFIVHFAETFIVPAGVGTYTIRPHGASVGKECAVLKAFVRVNP